MLLYPPHPNYNIYLRMLTCSYDKKINPPVIGRVSCFHFVDSLNGHSFSSHSDLPKSSLSTIL